tara:strand:+ start:19824 stop:21296 length:1473 start_codon:yes stop_codon:yes gene_type:complete
MEILKMGSIELELNAIDYLNNLNQEELNAIATGPQDLFFEYMQFMNNEFERHGMNQKIDVTDKWNWKPGTYDKIKHLLYRKLDMHKKSKSIDNLIDRTRDRNNYLSYVANQARQMERERYSLKRLGVSKNVDIDVFQAKCNEFVEDINIQCESVNMMSKGNVILKPYIELDLDTATNTFYLEITMNNMSLSVFSGEKEIHKSPVDTIHIIAKTSFRHLLNKHRNSQIVFKGTYKGDGFFPYISTRTFAYDGQYSTVCFDRYNDEIVGALKRNDYNSMAMLLMQWAQYYSTKYTNPYNQPYLLHIGMPENVSDEYYNQFDKSAVMGSCSNTMNIMTTKRKMNKLDALYYKLAKCEEINCKLLTECSSYYENSRDMTLYEDMFDIAEGVLGILLEYFEDANLTMDDKSYAMENICGIWIPYEDKDLEEYNDEFNQEMILYISRTINTQTNRYLYDYLVRNGLFEAIPPKKESRNIEEMKTIMRHWASDQEGA